MRPEQMTNEELANAIMEIEREFVWPHDGGDAKQLFEAARRLRNSIPKPVVDVYMANNLTTPILCVNGKAIMQQGDTVADAQVRLVAALNKGGGDDV